MNMDQLLNEIRIACETILGDKLTGVYVHGSIAFGCFDSRVSDVDFLVVAEESLLMQEKKALIETLLGLESAFPQKGPEMSVVLANCCKPFVYPTPYELHYSHAHRASARRDVEEYCRSMNGTDKDLAAHCTVTRAVGMVLCGKPVQDVFGEVPPDAYLDSLRYDVENAAVDIAENPVYIILNLCRVLAYRRHGAVISKKDGGLWGLSHLPECFHSLIGNALTAYTDCVPYLPNVELERAFVLAMHAEIFES